MLDTDHPLPPPHPGGRRTRVARAGGSPPGVPAPGCTRSRTRAYPRPEAVHPEERRAMTRIGYAAGAFDLFHVGHLNILKHAKSQCDFLIAGVVSDEMLERNKGITPVVPLAERLEIVSHISYVDEARAETLPDKLDTWRDVRFDVFFKGDDWRGTPKGERLEAEFAAVGVEVVYFPYTMHTSSTRLRRALDVLSGVGATAASPLATLPQPALAHQGLQ
jgi:glycerol-3-phosphate cytidylyltransferase